MRTLIAIMSLGILLCACKEPPANKSEVIRPIDWIQVETSSFDQLRRLSGTVQPVDSTSLSFQVGGKVQEVLVKLGDVVKKGDSLAVLDQRVYKMNQQSSQANLQKAKSALVEANNEFIRYTELSQKGLISNSGFDSAKSAYETANSSVNLAKSQLEISSKDLQDTRLYAPYDGKITQRLAEPSMQVTPGRTIFEIEGVNGLEIQILVPETLIHNLSNGEKVAIRFPVFPNIKANGTISEISTRAQTANAFPVTVAINSKLAHLRAGMTAEIDFTFKGIGITGHQGDVYRLPIGALGAGAGQSAYVFIYDTSTKTVRKQTVNIENIIDNQVLVSNGLKSGQVIASAGISFLRDGQTVSLLNKQVKRFN